MDGRIYHILAPLPLRAGEHFFYFFFGLQNQSQSLEERWMDGWESNYLGIGNIGLGIGTQTK